MNYNNSFNNIQSELVLFRNDSFDEEVRAQKTQQKEQKLLQHNIEHHTDDFQSENTIIGGIAYSTKDIEKAWIEVEYSEILQDDTLNQVHDLYKKESRLDCFGSTSHIRVTATIQTSTLLQQLNNNGDGEIYKRYRKQTSKNNRMRHHDTKSEINDRMEI